MGNPRRGGWTKLPSGSIRAYFVGPDGKRHFRTFSVREHAPTARAQEWLRTELGFVDDLLTAGRLAEWTPPEDRAAAQRQAVAAEADRREHAPDLAAYAEAWLTRPYENRRGEMVAKRPSYIRRADSLLRLHILPALGSAKVEAITPDQVRAWWQALPLGEHRRTCDLAYGVLRSILNTAVEDGLIETSPCHVSKAGRPSEERKVRALDYGQVEAIADHMPERWRLAVLLAGWLGLRDGEIRELRRKDIDLKAKTITISRQVTRGPGGPVVTDPKTEAGIRTVAMPAPLVDEVRQHLRDYAQIGPEGLLFYAVRSGQHAPDSPWRRALAAACEAAGLPPTSWHPLRHTALTRLALAGATKRELMATAGHRDGRAADRYQALAADHAAEVLDRVSDAIEAARKKPA